MKRYLLAATAVAAAIIAAPASAETVGQADLSYGFHNWDNNPGGDWNNHDIALGGAFTTDLGGGYNIQVDGQANSYRWDGSNSDDSMGQASVHVFTRNDQYAIGAFAGLADYYGDSGLMVGLEGQAYMTDVTFNASVGYVNFDDFNDYSQWNAQLGLRYFFNDNFAIDGSLGWVDWDTKFTDYDGWNGTIGGEYKFDGSPASVFINYRHDAIDRSSGSEYNVDAFTLGVRLTLGSDNLRARTNSGASMTGGQVAADNFLRW
ncbi:MAG: hypothetical protein K1X35_14615 [Caulobacteraceae bacterium]|nr:hypothetical protein [Caulobacteraceae bacterium]